MFLTVLMATSGTGRRVLGDFVQVGAQLLVEFQHLLFHEGLDVGLGLQGSVVHRASHGEGFGRCPVVPGWLDIPARPSIFSSTRALVVAAWSASSFLDSSRCRLASVRRWPASMLDRRTALSNWAWLRDFSCSLLLNMVFLSRSRLVLSRLPVDVPGRSVPPSAACPPGIDRDVAVAAS